jgi:hypothetical protein
MPLFPKNDGTVVSQAPMAIDRRWIMSYAAGVGDPNPAHYRAEDSGGLIAHPCMYWAISWPALQTGLAECFSEPLRAKEKGKGVHFGEDLMIFSPIRSDMKVTMSCKIVSATQKKNGTVIVSKHNMHDAFGTLLLTHWTTVFYRGVSLGSEMAPPLKNELPPVARVGQRDHIIAWWTIPIAWNEAHVYTECSRIFNPIHTDNRIAAAAGLPSIILHGTCILAKAVSEIRQRHASENGDVCRVSRLHVRSFAANVLMPCVLTLRIFSVHRDAALGELTSKYCPFPYIFFLFLTQAMFPPSSARSTLGFNDGGRQGRDP